MAYLYCNEIAGKTNSQAVHHSRIKQRPSFQREEISHAQSIDFAFSTSTGENYYISYKNKSNMWHPPVKIHEELQGVSPKVSPDGKYFFFLGGGIYWMPAKFIEELRPNKKKRDQ